MKTRGELADAVGNFIQDRSAARRVTILSDLDIAYDQALEAHTWPQFIRYSDVTVSVGAGQAYFHAPKDLRSLIRVIDTTTPGVLEQFGAAELIDILSGHTELSGIAVFFTFVGMSGINTTIAAGTELEVVSSAADTRTGVIVGRRDEQILTRSFTLNGINPVSLGPWDDVMDFHLDSSVTNLYVTLREVGTTTALSTVGPDEKSGNQRRYRLGAIPAAALNLRLVYYYQVPGALPEGYQYPIQVETYLYQTAVGMALQQRRQWQPAREHLAMGREALSRAIAMTERGRTRSASPGRPRRANLGSIIISPSETP